MLINYKRMHKNKITLDGKKSLVFKGMVALKLWRHLCGIFISIIFKMRAQEKKEVINVKFVKCLGLLLGNKSVSILSIGNEVIWCIV